MSDPFRDLGPDVVWVWVRIYSSPSSTGLSS